MTVENCSLFSEMLLTYLSKLQLPPNLHNPCLPNPFQDPRSSGGGRLRVQEAEGVVGRSQGAQVAGLKDGLQSQIVSVSIVSQV